MKDNQKLKNIFNLLFTLFMGLMFVTFSSLLNEIYTLHKSEKEGVVDNVIKSLLVQKSEIGEELFIGQTKSLNERVNKILDEYSLEDVEIAKVIDMKCDLLNAKGKCSDDYKVDDNKDIKKIVSITREKYTFITVPVEMFKKMIGKLIIKIPQKYTTVNRLHYVLINVVPFVFLILIWVVLYRYIEGKIISPHIEKMAELESKKLLYNSVLKVTHDLRAPIEVLNQISEYLAESEYGELMKLSTTRVTNIVNCCLEQSRLDVNEFITINVNDSFKNLLKEFEFREKKIAFEYNSGIDKKITIKQNDFLTLERSLSNLITNAIESIDLEGWVRLSINRSDYGVSITVQDNGKGISKTEIKMIFTKGYSSKIKGNGIGLSSTYNWVKSIKGNLEVISSLGVGSKFTLFIPCELEK